MITLTYPVKEYKVKEWLIFLKINATEQQVKKLYNALDNLDQSMGTFVTISYNDNKFTIIDTATDVIIKTILA